MQKSFVRGTWQVKRAFSPCVITQGGGRTIYIAGHTGQVDDSGKSLAGDFDAQFEQTFRNIERTLAEAGAKLSDMVTMTVFLIDARYTTRMTELRGELFGKDFPASAAITVQGFAQPEMLTSLRAPTHPGIGAISGSRERAYHALSSSSFSRALMLNVPSWITGPGVIPGARCFTSGPSTRATSSKMQ